MVCYAKITQTQMHNVDQIERAMLDNGYTISRKSELEITGTTTAGGYKILTYKRQSKDQAFQQTWGANGEGQKIGKNYAAQTVAQFAKTRGFSITQSAQQKANQTYVLVRR